MHKSRGLHFMTNCISKLLTSRGDTHEVSTLWAAALQRGTLSVAGLTGD